MKKFLSIFCATLSLSLFSANSHATGFFIGADALFANSQHSAENLSAISGPKNDEKKDADNLSYSANAGFRFDLLNLLASAEIFYDDLQTSSKDFSSTSGQISNGDSIGINNRYGAKLNAGIAIIPKVTTFVTYGLTNVNYTSDVLSQGISTTKSEMTPLYGVGILVDLPLGFSAKASYDYQQFKMRYAIQGSRIKTSLGVGKIGVVYNF